MYNLTTVYTHMNSQQNNNNRFEYLTSLAGFLLPLLQFFFNFLPGTNKNIFLFKDSLLFVSAFAAVMAYLLIIVAKNKVWFSFAFNRKRHHAYQAHIAKQNVNVYGEAGVRSYLRTNPYVKMPFYITPDTMFTLTVPFIVVAFSILYVCGLVYINGSLLKVLTAIQAITYIALIAITALTLAIYQIKGDSNRKHDEAEKTRVANVVQLAFENSAFSELPRISLIAQFEQGQVGFRRYVFLLQVNDAYYKIFANYDVTKIESAERFESYEDLLASFNQSGGLT